MAPISRALVAELERFVVRHRLPVVLFAKGQHKNEVMAADSTVNEDFDL
jgi:hypothetical protein